MNMKCLAITLALSLALGLTEVASSAEPRSRRSQRVNMEPIEVTSPDGLVRLILLPNAERLTLTVTRSGVIVLEPSPIVLKLDGYDLTSGVVFRNAERYEINEDYPWYGDFSVATNHCRGVRVTLDHDLSMVRHELEVRAFNDGVAFRHVIPGDVDVTRVPDEYSTFVLPAGSMVWYAGLAAGHYEDTYQKREALGVQAGEWGGPPLTFRLPGEAGYASITEANLVGYSGMGLESDGRRGWTIALGHRHPLNYPFELRYGRDEGRRLGQPAAIQGTITTPWRVVMLGPDLNTLVNSAILPNLCPPPDPHLFPDGLKTIWIKPGRAVWRYVDGGPGGVEGMKEFSRLAGQLGFQHHVIEGFWSRWSPEERKEVVEVSKQQGVGLWFWKHSNQLRTPEAREEFFRMLHDLGVVGAKIDFMDHEHREVVDLYESLLREAAKHQVMVNFHGANKPTGRERTLPNDMVREAVKGMEASRLTERARHQTILPFTRYLAGAADYTTMIFSQRRGDTTWANQLASLALFSSPLLTVAANPQTIVTNPAVEMIKSIPAVWDETRVLAGSEIGELAAFARRTSNTWFIAAICGPEPRTIEVPLAFLSRGPHVLSIVRDGDDDTSLLLESTFKEASDVLRLELRAGGGYIARLTQTRPPEEQAASVAEPLTVARLIEQAGTTEDELERLRWLRALTARTDLDSTLRGDLAKLLPVVEEWADGKSRVVVDNSRAAENGYLCRFIAGRVRPASEGPVYPPTLSDGSPLRPLWCLYRGRMLIWQVIQSGPLLRVKERREAYYGEGRRLLEEARRAYPDNRIIGMYLGHPIPWPKAYPADPAAPAWANLQREGLEKLADIIHWWAAERQLPDGQFGGGWGDDVEMWRWWTPVLIAFEDPVVNTAQERLSSGIFHQPHMRTGFTSRLTDVEHSNEDTTDTILPMMHLRPDDPVWKQRALHLAELMRDRWTARNERGQLQFKSIYFSADRVDAQPGRAFDTVYHPSVVQPALLYWQRTGDAALTALFGDWLKTWVDAAARAENGKPAGVLPSAIRWPDGGIAKADLPWWEPFSPGHNDALYNWPGATRLMTSSLLLAYHLTQDESYLEPIRSMTALREKHGRAAEGELGSEAWCARLMSGFLPDALAKYRLLTGDPRHDGLLRNDASGYVRYRLSGDATALESGLRRNAEAFRSNWEAYTSEMRWTDRVMSFTRNYLGYLPEAAPPSPSPDLLYNSATGDPGNPLVFPLNAVRWRTPPREIAALVKEASRTLFIAELFHFGERPRDLEAELFLLSPGAYELTITPADGAGSARLVRHRFRLEGPRGQVSLQLPPRRLCVVKVEAATDTSEARLPMNP